MPAIRFERQPIAPAPMIDPGSGMGSEAEQLSRALRAFSAPVMERQARLGVAQADRAGRESGLAGNLDPIAGGGRDQLAFASAQQEAYVQQLHSEVRNMTSELAAKHPADPDAFAQEFDQRAQEISSKVNPEVRGLVGGEISMRRDAAISGVRATFEQNQQVMQEKVRTGFQSELLEDAKRFSREGNAEGQQATFGKFETFWHGEVAANRMLPEQVDQARANLHEETMGEVVQADFEDALKAGHGQAYLDHFRGGGAPPELRVDQIDKLGRRMESGINRQTRQFMLAQRQRDAIVKGNGDHAERLSTLYKAGVDVGEQGEQLFDDMISGKVPVPPDKLEGLIMARDGHDVTAVITRMPVVNAEAAVAAVAAQPPTTLITAVHKQAAEKALGTLRDGLRDDPTAFALAHGVGVVNDPGQPDFANPQALRGWLQTTKAATDEMEQVYGQKFSPFTKAQAAQFKDVLEHGDTDSAAAMLGAVADTYGADAGIVFSELGRKGADALAYAGHMVAEGSGDIAREVLTARTIDPRNTGVFDEKFAINSRDKIYSQAAGSAFPDPAMRAVHRKITDQLYMVRALKQNLFGFNEELYRQAAADAAGGFVDISTGSFWGGRTYSKLAAPWKGATQDQVQAWLGNLSAADLEASGGTAMGQEPGGEAEVARRIHAGGAFESAPGGLRVRIGGTLLTDRRGDPFLLRPRVEEKP